MKFLIKIIILAIAIILISAGGFIEFNPYIHWILAALASSWRQVSMVFLIISFFLVIFVVEHKIRTKKRRKEVKKVPAGTKEPVCADQTSRDRLIVARYFLNLFKRKHFVTEEAYSEIILVEKMSSGSGYIYELRVKKSNDEWESRRMTIGALGEGSGSKSKCYYAIYDIYFVIKIPPVPIMDFKEYIESIKKDSLISRKLAPRECIVPNVSVIMKMVQDMPGAEEINEEKLETRYISLLERQPEFQDFLKIGDSFVYFMDLSKYFFLGHTIDSIHDIKGRLVDEIAGNSDILWDSQAFEGRYGQQNLSLCFEIQNVYKHFEQGVNRFFGNAGIPHVQQFQMRKWFLRHLAGKPILENEKELSAEHVKELSAIAEKVLSENEKPVAVYKNAINLYVRNILFLQNKPQIGAIITNLIELLAWLGEKGVAMRDLKPDNLLVAGDQTNYPLFLKSASGFKIGLIDVETAVDFNPSGGKEIDQPQLGGTPFYATPTHLFTNELILFAYGDLPRIFRFQDWHAVVGMIYKIVTGETLFLQTGKLMPTVRNTLQQSLMEGKDISEIIGDIGQMFWRSAMIEFKSKLKRKEKMMKSIDVAVMDNVKGVFVKEALAEKKHMDEAIEKYIHTQTVFTGEKEKKDLLLASREKIIQLRGKMEGGNEKTEQRSKKKTEIIKMLKEIEQLKFLLEQKSQNVALLMRPNLRLSAYELLELMFNMVFASMYKDEWGAF